MRAILRMESLLTKLVTYKLMDFSSLLSRFFNQPPEKLLFSVLLLLSIIGTSIYILFRTVFQQQPVRRKGSILTTPDPQLLLDSWIDQNRGFCEKSVELCVSFINSYADLVKVTIFCPWIYPLDSGWSAEAFVPAKSLKPCNILQTIPACSVC